jgi:hypothetical protein
MRADMDVKFADGSRRRGLRRVDLLGRKHERPAQITSGITFENAEVVAIGHPPETPLSMNLTNLSPDCFAVRSSSPRSI